MVHPWRMRRCIAGRAEIPIPTGKPETQVEINSSGEKRRETNDAPFRQIEWLKQNFLHQLERFAERFKDFDFSLGTVHGAISGLVSTTSKNVVATAELIFVPPQNCTEIYTFLQG